MGEGGDMDKAFDILVEQYRPMVLTYLKTLVADRGLAEDLTQETFLAAYRSLDSVRDTSKFGAYLRGIARNKVLETRRATARRPLVVDSRIVEGMEQVYSAFDVPQAQAPVWSERLALIHQCIARLGGKLKRAMFVFYGRGRSIRETAEALGTTFEVTAKRLSRGRTQVRKCVLLRLKHEAP